LIVGVDVGL